MITVVSFTETKSAVYGTAMDNGAGYERFYGFALPVEDPTGDLTPKKIAGLLEPATPGVDEACPETA